ncbi:MAG: glutathione S-transferase family protein, partial [Halieaceae bacterium]|nr:glutathione S-transferase family protein [Halieaceae bacterium]
MPESQTPILYHYLASPYSEKLRLALGVAGIQWGSVIVPAQPPRPFLDVFLSGYRRIPVLQIGAHFYCDSALAFDALAEVSDRLKPAGHLSRTNELLRRHAEDRIFFAVIAAASPISVLRLLAQDLGLFGMFRFLKDRSDMMKGSAVEKQSQRAAARLVKDFVEQLNGLLKQDRFLGGAHAGYLDLCCYHPLWMASVINRETLSA